MILSLEDQISCSFYQNYLEGKTKEQILVILRFNDSAYSEEENLRMLQLLWVMLINNLWNILNMSYTKRIYYIFQLTGRKGGKLFIHILERSGTQKINKKRFYFAFLHSLYWYKQNTLKLVKTLPVLKTSLLNIK